ncbi:hypothetical protein Bhyg_04035 [Pseudolycoriella hygida]|uniref:Uncharacterized protein n=1 Tax=Pseudolycoriella hygida TaxID=35572 RepID=A0A9Q0S999_9DIPT|nr:hypothetical protein Bhyg_04035 [Pseudolycoriella hygida]
MSKDRKTRLRSAPNKIWTDEEVLSMLFYILDRQNDGKLLEKPTHESLMTKLMWSNVRWQQVKAKVHNLRKKYIDMKNWMDQTGQGVDSGSIEDYKSKKCSFHELLHSIFGNRSNVSIAYVYDSLRNQKHSDAQESNDCERYVGEIVADENGDGVASNIIHTDFETLTDENGDGETLTVIDEALTPRTLPPATDNIGISDTIVNVLQKFSNLPWSPFRKQTILHTIDRHDLGSTIPI